MAAGKSGSDVAIPGADSVDAPVANLPLIVLSYDRDSIIALLETKRHPGHTD